MALSLILILWLPVVLALLLLRGVWIVHEIASLLRIALMLASQVILLLLLLGVDRLWKGGGGSGEDSIVVRFVQMVVVKVRLLAALIVVCSVFALLALLLLATILLVLKGEIHAQTIIFLCHVDGISLHGREARFAKCRMEE